MATLLSGTGPGPRIAAGSLVLERAEHVDTKKVDARLKAFAAVHGKYVRAQTKTEKAHAALAKVEQAVAAADVLQDEAVDALANALAGDGHKRDNPFKELGFAAPAAVAKLGYAVEAKTVARLAAAVAKKKGLSKKSLAAADAAKKAAASVTRALEPVTTLDKARRQAIAERDGMAQAWETAFAALKRGAKAAEDEGASGLFQALFAAPPPTSDASATRPAKKKKPTPTPPTPPTPPAPPAPPPSQPPAA